MIDKNHLTLYILEFEQPSDRNEDILGVQEDEGNEQHKSIIESLKVDAPERTLEKINFVVGRRGVAVEDNLYNKLKRLSVQVGKKDKILSAHV